MPLVLHSILIAVGLVDHVLCPTPSQYLIGSSMYFPLRLRILAEDGWCPETLQPLPVPLAALSARAGSYRLIPWARPARPALVAERGATLSPPPFPCYRSGLRRHNYRRE